MSDDFITVATFSQPHDAYLAKAKLESEGITCFVADEYFVTVNWLFSNAIGGVKLQVPKWESELARDVLRPRPQLIVVAKEGDGSIPEDERVCPRCGSLDVYYTRFSRRAGFLAIALVGFLLPWIRRRWQCKQCDFEWKDDDRRRHKVA